MNFFRRKPAPAPEPTEQAARQGIFSTDLGPLTDAALTARRTRTAEMLDLPGPGRSGVATDNAIIGEPYSPKERYMQSIPEAQLYWYASQGHLGGFINSVIAQHWLVDKACSEPAKDAIRQGWTLDAVEPGTLDALDKVNEQFCIDDDLVEYIQFGRVHGGRIAYFRVASTDPDYYQKPFNLDGVTPGSYGGIVQIDADDATPLPTDSNLDDPSHPEYYKPTFYQIGRRVFHRSHLFVFIPYPVANRLKPAYRFFGVSVPQRIYERVYGAERSANEAPQLAMTKRLVSAQVSEQALDSPEALRRGMAFFAETRDNYGVYAHGPNETITQQDTSLTDVDTVIMTQYQLVAAAASVPATKLLGTSPKGFAATGEYEESVYREHLEGLQATLTPLMERHYQIALRARGIKDTVVIKWNPLDSPTAVEWAAINYQKAQTAALYVDKMIIDNDEARQALALDENSDFYGIDENAPTDYDYQTPGKMGGQPSSGLEGFAPTLPGASTTQVPDGLGVPDSADAGRV